MAKYDVALLVGSLRRESINRKVAKALQAMAPASLGLDMVEIGDLPLYNQDLESNVPPAWEMFRDRMRPAQAVLFVTPEYNRSVPAVLKNALDVGSRPFGSSVWDRKPAGIVSASPGAVGGFGANHHLRQMLVFLNMPALQQPEVYLNGADRLFEGDTLANGSVRDFLGRFLQAFAAWVELHARPA